MCSASLAAKIDEVIESCITPAATRAAPTALLEDDAAEPVVESCRNAPAAAAAVKEDVMEEGCRSYRGFPVVASTSTFDDEDVAPAAAVMDDKPLTAVSMSNTRPR